MPPRYALEPCLCKYFDKKAYAGLGHSLGLAKSVIDDDFRPMKLQPLEDLASWVLGR
jgi:hypothetical protein